MTATVKIGLYLAIFVLITGVCGTLYWSIYNKGKTAVIVEQEKKLNTIKEKTGAAKTDAFTTDKPSDELRKYSRPD
jgi:hypothetical protein